VLQYWQRRLLLHGTREGAGGEAVRRRRDDYRCRDTGAVGYVSGDAALPSSVKGVTIVE
jgi:hypothetical protein